jgi:short-subunit dehydrogenase
VGGIVTNALVIGAASELGSKIVLGLNERKISVTAVSRSPLSSEVVNAFKITETNFEHKLVDSYLEIESDKDYKYIFFTTGIFNHNKITNISEEEITKEIEENVSQPILLTKRFLDICEKNTIFNKNFVYIGSTTAYQGFSGMSTYCASKFALRGFVQSMNDEYITTGNRFLLVSMGTMNTKMGRKHADSIGRSIESLIDPNYVAQRVLSSIFESESTFEPEMIFRHRNPNPLKIKD